MAEASDSALPPDPTAPNDTSGAVQENSTEEDQADPVLETVLSELWSAWSQQRGPLSLARLCKRTGLRMSTLKRFITVLEGTGIVGLSINARGVECASLTETAAADLTANLTSQITSSRSMRS